MLLQLRVTVPPDRTAAVRALFEECPGTAHLAVLPGASVTPAGDLVLADVARESADGLVLTGRATTDAAEERAHPAASVVLRSGVMPPVWYGSALR